MAVMSQLLNNLASRIPSPTQVEEISEGIFGLTNLEDLVFQDVGSKVNGISALSNTLPQPEYSDIKFQDPKIASFGGDTAGFENLFTTKISGSTSTDIKKMTNSSKVKDGENFKVLSLGKPFAIANTINAVLEKTAPWELISPFVPIHESGPARKIFDTNKNRPLMPAADIQLNSVITSILGRVTSAIPSDYRSSIGNIGFISALISGKNDIVSSALQFLNLSDDIKLIITELVTKGLKDLAVDQIIKNLNEDQLKTLIPNDYDKLPTDIKQLVLDGKLGQAISQAKNEETKNILQDINSTIEQSVKSINPSISEETTSPVFDVKTVPSSPINSNQPPASTVAKFQGWSGKTKAADMQYGFYYVEGKDDLIADLNYGKENREITTLVNHWTANYKDDYHIDAKIIHDMHVENPFNFDGCGYNYIIRTDGRIQRGRPVTLVGEHTKNMNSRTIGLAGVGGLSVTRQLWERDAGKSYKNAPYGGRWYTDAQMESFKLFAECFYTVFPGGEIYGHMDMEPDRKPDPGWSEEMLPSLFGKYNRFTPSNGAPTAAQILGNQLDNNVRRIS